jgi:RNA polymerase sigma-70 factor, ECF subfamily
MHRMTDDVAGSNANADSNTAEAEAAGGDTTDEVLIGRVLGGDTAAFELLMRRNNSRVFRAARAVLKNDDEAEDAMQQAYLSAYTHLAEFGGRARFSTWLVRIAVYEALGRLRRSKRTASLDDVEETEEPMATTRNPEDATSDVELRGLLDEAVDALPLGFRTVFVMRAVEEMSAVETAEALGIPAETVRTRLHRARGLLREHLAKKLESAAPKVYEFHLSRCDRVVLAVLAQIQATLPRG